MYESFFLSTLIQIYYCKEIGKTSSKDYMQVVQMNINKTITKCLELLVGILLSHFKTNKNGDICLDLSSEIQFCKWIPTFITNI